MSFEHDVQVFNDMVDLISEPGSAERDAELASLLEEADADNLVNSMIGGRVLMLATAVNVHDPDRTVGLLAESQRIWRENKETVLPESVHMIGLQTMATILMLELNYQVPAAAVRPLCESYIDQSASIGQSTQTAHRLAMICAWNEGDAARARAHFDQAMLQPVDEDMPGLSQFDLYFLSDTDEQAAVNRYRQLLASASPTSKEPAPETHSAALLPLLRTGNAELAAHAFNNRDVAEPCGEDIAYLASLGRFDEAVTVAETFIADDPDDEGDLASLWYSRLDQGQFMALLLAHLSAAGHGAVLDPRLGEGTINELLRHYTDQAEHYARKADEVNSSQVQITRLHSFWNRHRPSANQT